MYYEVVSFFFSILGEILFLLWFFPLLLYFMHLTLGIEKYAPRLSNTKDTLYLLFFFFACKKVFLN